MQILHSTLTPAEALGAAAATRRFDLPVNPLSVILLTLRALNNTAVVANYSARVATLIGKILNARVRYRGATVIDGDPLDLIQVYGGYSKWWPTVGQHQTADNSVRTVVFPLLFGRQPYDPIECFPATRRGDLQLELDTTADPVGLDGYELAIETIELLDATPERFIKVSTTERTLQAGPVNSVDLPIGNRLLGLLLNPVSFPSGLSFDASFARVNLEVDNVEVVLSTAQWLGLHANWRRRATLDWLHNEHSHQENLAAAYTQNAQTLEQSNVSDVMARYGWVELDPMNDTSHALDTKAAADISLEVDSDITDAQPSKVLPIEYVEVGGGGSPAAA